MINSQTTKIIVPYRLDQHFVLAFLHIDGPRRTWSADIFDSLGRNTTTAMMAEGEILRLTDHCRATPTSIFYKFGALGTNRLRVPRTLRQRNDYDGGIYVICAAELLTKGMDLPVALDCEEERWSIAYQIMWTYFPENDHTAEEKDENTAEEQDENTGEEQDHHIAEEQAENAAEEQDENSAEEQNENTAEEQDKNTTESTTDNANEYTERGSSPPHEQYPRGQKRKRGSKKSRSKIVRLSVPALRKPARISAKGRAYIKSEYDRV